MANEVPAKTHGVGVFLELRRRLQSGLLIVGKDVAQTPADVAITSGDSSLHIRTPRGVLYLTLPAGVTFEQGSCIPTPAGESCGEELHFRLRISVERSTDEDSSASMMKMLRAKKAYCFYCQGCMTRLLEDRVFKRVLPLPNARDGSCEQTLTEEVSPVGTEDSQDPKKPCRRLALISCASCSSVLGEAVAPETLKLYVTQVVVEPAVGDRKPEASLNRSLFVERTVAVRLLELSNSLSTYHFSVQTPDGKAFLLLWLLNSDSIIASVPETRVGTESSNGSPALHSPSPRATRALKLLYIACSDTGIQQRDTVTSWEVSVIGHPVVLPLKVCEELLQVMDDSNSTLPASMRCMRSYEVAYLRL
uniref:E3 ubiquitin-protein ligase E3D n=1 Tax=Haplochromis burtoni TaxID=8153 RepID=A0A3Q2WTT4_HAPBU